ncbi:DUF6207 family protein [Streptomyces eurythermus]
MSLRQQRRGRRTTPSAAGLGAIPSADETTVLAFQQMLAGPVGGSGSGAHHAGPGQSGVRLRCYPGLRQELPARS